MMQIPDPLQQLELGPIDISEQIDAALRRSADPLRWHPFWGWARLTENNELLIDDLAMFDPDTPGDDDGLR